MQGIAANEEEALSVYNYFESSSHATDGDDQKHHIKEVLATRALYQSDNCN